MARTTKSKAQTEDGTEVEMLQVIFVRSFPETFRRAGHVFTREGHGLCVADLTDEQLAAIEGEPMLSVQYSEVPVRDDAKGSANSADDPQGGV